MKKIINSTKKVVVKKTGWLPRIRSRHPSHSCFRGALPRMPFTSVIRFGSTTEEDAQVEINSIEAIRNSSSKLRMKNCFTKGSVKTANWLTSTNPSEINVWCAEYPIVGKQIFGSRGRGNTLLHSKEELKAYLARHKDLSNYIFEKFYNYVREYRLHVTELGCFYTCRKMLKSDAPKEARWFRNDSNCVWIMEQNELFDKPVNWEIIVAECVKALKSCGLDFGACDLRVQSSKDSSGKIRKDPDFIVVEINSAPSMGEQTEIEYKKMLPILLQNKFKK